MEKSGKTEPQTVGVLRDGFGRVLESIQALMERTDPQLLGYRPSEHANSIAWLVWHLTRVQDDHFAHLANALWPDSVAEQCWISGGWYSAFDLPYARLDTGYGHSSEQVGECGTLDAVQLLEYYRAVQEFSNGVLGRLREEDFGTVIDRRWDPPVTVAVRLVSILNDTTKHAGQAEYVKGLFESGS